MKLKVVRADPAGNITLFVLDPLPTGERAGIAARLMSRSNAEQVGFVCPPVMGGAGRLEMAGGEFCGNATRAFGMLTAQALGGPAQVLVEVSGCAYPVTVDVDLAAGTAQAQMPLPRTTELREVDGYTGTLVDLGGIAHFVVEGVAPSLDFFERAEPLFQKIPGLEAYGVIFLEGEKMTPLVKVPAAGTLVWEGSCGSGSLAAAAAQSRNAPDGPFVRDYIQPAGAIQAAIVRRNGEAVSACIGGPVVLGLPCEIEI